MKSKFKLFRKSWARDSLVNQDLTAEEVEDNAYGEIMCWDEPNKKYMPVICGHGGSMWLCRGCLDRIAKEEGLK